MSVNILKANIEDDLKMAWRWSSYSLKSGLPSNNVIKIVESSDKTLWVVTPKGFAWFDNFIWHEVVADSAGFTAEELVDFMPDRGSGIMGTDDGSIYFVNKDTIRVINLKINSEEIFVDEITIYDSLYYLGRGFNKSNNEEFLFFYDGKDDVQVIPMPENPQIIRKRRYIRKASNGDMWFTGNSGLYRFTGENWVKYMDNQYDYPFTLSDVFGRKNYPGFFWLGYPYQYSGIWEISESGLEINQKIKTDRVFLIGDINNDGQAVLIFVGGIIYLKNGNDWYEFKNPPELLKNASYIKFSSNNNLWVATEDNLYLVNLSSKRWDYINFQNGSGWNLINDIFFDKENNLWVGTDQGLIDLKNRSNPVFYEFVKGKSLSGVTGINQDNEGNIWVGSGGNFMGVYKFDGKYWTHYDEKNGFFNTNVHKIKKDRKGNLWFLTLNRDKADSGNGAFLYMDKTFYSWSNDNGMDGDRVYDFIEDSNGSYWFATSQGLNKWQDSVFYHWDKSNGMRFNRVFAITETQTGGIWFTDQYTGLGYLQDKEFNYPRVFMEEGIYFVREIYNTKKRLWISTKNGVFSYKNGIVSHFNQKNGLGFAQTWPLNFNSGDIYIGTLGNGINILNTDEENHPAPVVVFSDIKGSGSSVTISWDTYAYLGQLASDQIQVRYKLDNADWTEWNYDRNINLYDLTSGEHSIVVQAKGLFGNYLEKGYCLDFMVPYPTYMQPVFFIPLTILIILAGFFVFIYFRKKIKADREIRKLNKDLEKRVSDRTAKLKITLDVLKQENIERKKAEKEVRKAQKKLTKAYDKEKELSEMRSRFIDMISHEYRTPLTIILSSAELIKIIADSGKSEGVDKHIYKIRSSVKALIKMLEDTMMLSSNTDQELEYTPSLVNIRMLCYDLLDEIRVIDGGKHKFLHKFNLGSDVIETDPKLLHQILINLLLNARKFSPDNSEINLNCFEDQSYIIFQVCDKGCGISQEDRKNIFKPFYKNKNDIGLVEGTGLGLSIVKKCADRMGARIVIESEIGQGSEFTVIIPKKKSLSN